VITIAYCAVILHYANLGQTQFNFITETAHEEKVETTDALSSRNLIDSTLNFTGRSEYSSCWSHKSTRSLSHCGVTGIHSYIWQLTNVTHKKIQSKSQT